MGCDIHTRCEVKVNGKWELNTEKVFLPRHEHDKSELKTDPPEWRSYDWFAVLADVRNGKGFAGLKTGDGFSVIAEPRGVPADATEEWRQYVDDWDSDMHSASWLTLSDFKKFDWSQRSVKCGVISLEQYKALRETKDAPDSWCGSVGGRDIITISMDEADEHIKSPKDAFNKQRVYVFYAWEVLYSDWFKGHIENWINPMEDLATRYEDVRIVFGFDN